jgi:hypothetical protein
VACEMGVGSGCSNGWMGGRLSGRYRPISDIRHFGSDAEKRSFNYFNISADARAGTNRIPGASACRLIHSKAVGTSLATIRRSLWLRCPPSNKSKFIT